MSDSDITQLLERWQEGDAGAFDQLLTLVYPELRKVAQSCFRGERRDHTLQPTEVLHEAYSRLAGGSVGFENRAHFFGAAARVMRQVLVDHARRRAAAKRPPSERRATLLEASSLAVETDVDVLALHSALNRLEEVEPRQARIVELRYFGGLSREEVGGLLGISRETVAREWRVARMLLRRWLSGLPEEPIAEPG